MNESAPTQRVPWGVLDCVAVVALTAVAVVVAVNVIAFIGATTELFAEWEVLLLPLPLAVLAAVTLAWVQVRHRAVSRLIGPGRGGFKEWLIGAGLGVAAFVVVNVGMGILIQIGAALFDIELPQPQTGLREAAADPGLLPWMVLSAVIVAPLAEELFFRGMLYQGLRKRSGVWPAIALSAVVFAAAHVLAETTLRGGALVFVLILPLGVLLAWLFERRGTLITPIAVHAVFNGVTLALMLLVTRDGIMAGG